MESKLINKLLFFIFIIHFSLNFCYIIYVELTFFIRQIFQVLSDHTKHIIYVELTFTPQIPSQMTTPNISLSFQERLLKDLSMSERLLFNVK